MLGLLYIPKRGLFSSEVAVDEVDSVRGFFWFLLLLLIAQASQGSRITSYWAQTTDYLLLCYLGKVLMGLEISTTL